MSACWYTAWEQGNPNGCPPVFGPDAEDPMGVDLYTSGFAPYAGVQLFFPATMYSFGADFPWGYGNDGILDVRFAASRDGKAISYVPGAANAREPWFELGLNRCGPHAHAPDSYRGGWCDPTDAGQMSRTDPHTTANYMVRQEPPRPPPSLFMHAYFLERCAFVAHSACSGSRSGGRAYGIPEWRGDLHVPRLSQSGRAPDRVAADTSRNASENCRAFQNFCSCT